MGNPTPSLRLSCEYFPPKTAEGKHKLLAAHDRLQALSPAFVSVTYGAGGSTRTNTRDMVLELKRRGSCVAPHLSFGGDDESLVLELLQVYRDNGIRRLVALRGDMPSGMGGMSQMVYAAELVAFVRRPDDVTDPAVRKEMAAIAGNQKHIEQCPLFLVFLADVSRNTRLAEQEKVELAGLPFLEAFLVANWSQTELAKDFAIYEEDGEPVGQQYATDAGPIDILAVSHDRKRLLVVELKRGRASDVVVGQILRYMGYIKEQVAEPGQAVEGVIIALENDQKLRWALSAVPNIRFYRYQVSFRLVLG